MDTKRRNHQGFRLRSILIHSLWITAAGILLFRLATANTQKNLLYVRMFSISGVALATAPWVFQLLLSTTIMVLYHTGVCDFTWLVKPALPVHGRGEVDHDIEGGGTMIRNRLRFKGEATIGPKLLRNRTI
ncbi:hypothetical protein Vadar_016641 [Vaccinium darrowii]|uniref:Uncharacterized protein n=1 Tax=Vaccinium darrowii TaxID=229202 RepID=A0ACB7XAU2_9ERIC|nr:hypothetical protein Vadar_016641 [Vaccinium darrowii]